MDFLIPLLVIVVVLAIATLAFNYACTTQAANMKKAEQEADIVPLFRVFFVTKDSIYHLGPVIPHNITSIFPFGSTVTLFSKRFATSRLERHYKDGFFVNENGEYYPASYVERAGIVMEGCEDV